jgi:hypothetical protein
MPKKQADKVYKKGQPFIFNGDVGWTIIEVQADAIVVERHKPWRVARLPFGSFKT